MCILFAAREGDTDTRSAAMAGWYLKMRFDFDVNSISKKVTRE